MALETDFNFCPVCGAALFRQLAMAGGRPPQVCRKCGYRRYEDPKLAVAGLLYFDERVLLVKRARSVQKGKWCLPGGFMDRGETVTGALVRECLEETGLHVQPVRMIGLYSYENDPTVVAIYQVRETGGALVLTDECEDARWFSFSGIPWPDLAFQSAVDCLNDFKEQIAQRSQAPVC